MPFLYTNLFGQSILMCCRTLNFGFAFNEYGHKCDHRAQHADHSHQDENALLRSAKPLQKNPVYQAARILPMTQPRECFVNGHCVNR
mmetsp:Transcript_36742/g.70442  ORF Transcript_36742/g.70442 Transcript_36742/m.70442 type:complete len:87 (-) Transcript_36742:306-566(-)